MARQSIGKGAFARSGRGIKVASVSLVVVALFTLHAPAARAQERQQFFTRLGFATAGTLLALRFGSDCQRASFFGTDDGETTSLTVMGMDCSPVTFSGSVSVSGNPQSMGGATLTGSGSGTLSWIMSGTTRWKDPNPHFEFSLSRVKKELFLSILAASVHLSTDVSVWETHAQGDDFLTAQGLAVVDAGSSILSTAKLWEEVRWKKDLFTAMGKTLSKTVFPPRITWTQVSGQFGAPTMFAGDIQTVRQEEDTRFLNVKVKRRGGQFVGFGGKVLIDPPGPDSECVLAADKFAEATTCFEQYPLSVPQVTLTAVADDNAEFKRWTEPKECEKVKDTVCEVVLDQDVKVAIAEFIRK